MVDPEASTLLDATVAGFIVWLAHQNPPHDERTYCPAHVERFLRWRHEQQAKGAQDDAEAFFIHLRLEGQPEVRVAEARTAIALLRQFLRSPV